MPNDGIEIVSRTIEAIAPGLALKCDDFVISRWLQDINGDPWWIAAALCEAKGSLKNARGPKFATRVLERRRDEGWTCENAREYVEHMLNPKRRAKLAEAAV